MHLYVFFFFFLYFFFLLLFMYTEDQKFGIIKIFNILERSLMLTKAAFFPQQNTVK